MMFSHKELFFMSSSKAHIRAVAKYTKENYEDLRVRVPKGRKAELEARVKAEGKSINGIINDFLRGYLGMDEAEWKMKSGQDVQDMES